MRLNIAIVEDNREDADLLKKYVTAYLRGKDCECAIELFGNSDIFVNLMSSKYNLVFLDIEMPNVSGMEIARKLRAVDKNVTIVFVTAMAQYAVEGYEVNAFDYIVKPVSYDIFKIKFKRILDSLRLSSDDEIWIKAVGLCVKRINISQIKYVEVVKHDCVYHTEQGDYKVTTSMQKVFEELKAYSFALCGQGYLVNLKYVSEVLPDTAVVAGERIPISRSRRKEFMSKLNNFLVHRGSV